MVRTQHDVDSDIGQLNVHKCICKYSLHYYHKDAMSCIPKVLTELHVAVERPISIVLKSHFQETFKVGTSVCGVNG